MGMLEPMDNGNTCSCGNPEPHIVARRTTADSTILCLWSDGDVTLRLGFVLKGLGRGRSGYADRCNALAARVVFDDACLLTVPEFTASLKLARKLARQSGWTPEAIRARVRQVW